MFFRYGAATGTELHSAIEQNGTRAEGKPKKEAPPTAWQYSEYLLRQIEFFKSKDRLHDNDPEDETFDDYTKQEIIDILTFISTLDD